MVFQVDSLCFRDATQEVAAQCLQCAGMMVKLLVVHNPQGYDFFQAEMDRTNMEVLSSFAETELRPLELRVMPGKSLRQLISLSGPLTTAVVF